MRSPTGEGGAPRLPERFLERMQAWLGPEVGAFLQALAGPYRTGLRVNTLKIAPEAFRARSPFPLSPVPWCPEGFVIEDPEARPGLHPYHAAGLYYLQDPSAMAAAVLLDPQPGEWVLDLAAAPGGKTTHLAARMQDTGVLVANEIQPRRASILALNVERLGVTHAILTNESPPRLADRWEGLFDRVLVDAPCSGEGMFARDPEAIRAWSVDRVRRSAALQKAILLEAARMVRPGGWLLYATCTFAPEENEGVVEAFLQARPDFDLVDPPRHAAFDRGRPEWIEGGDPRLARAVRLWPHRGPGHGHFYALFRRAGEERPHRPKPESDLPGRARRALEAFWAETIARPLPEGGLVLQGEQIYWTPMASALWRGLRVLRPGWWLGRWRKDRFEPDHALAMALRVQEVRQALDLPLWDPRVVAYLQGHPLEGPWESGWALIALEGFPLGWARAERGRLKNLYPRHLRTIGWWEVEAG
ncbi:RsmB/NOP family class I SAM-dependent RNA methyltransferase [Thermoflexus sp.]|uniref:RsmB/NOP family class I SAM-dependent RNA methyltransferase n=1 Tax=Thermoflexus sp. TaxID=1969742 RepID=UPI002ADD4998|nr:RsmB/NOP family class I SAM-dependent RNA methyltransferase [Thermoflexus sp.]